MPIPEIVEKFDRPLARDLVYTTIRQWILDGVCKPGEVVRDKVMADTLGVSRTPVREALRRLEDEGLVQTAAHRWTRVSPIDLNEASNIYPIIATLESLAIALSVQREQIRNEDLMVMRAENERLAQSLVVKDPLEASLADYRFHQTFIERSMNTDLNSTIRSFKARLHRLEVAYFDGCMVAERAIDEHAAIVEALSLRDAERAALAVQTNWRESLRRIQEGSEASKNLASTSEAGPGLDSKKHRIGITGIRSQRDGYGNGTSH